MSAPTDFCRAFEELKNLTDSVASGELPKDQWDQVGRAAIRWLYDDACGSLTPAKAAILAMRHESGT